MGSPFIIVPTYREMANLPEFTEAVWRSQPAARVLIVDDASGDGAPAWIKSHERYKSALFLLERPGKMGLGSAYIAGFQWLQDHAGDCSAVVQMDADLSHDPAAIEDFLRALADGADLALATRYRGGVRVTNWPLSRLMLSLGAAKFVQWTTGMPFTDPTGGFKAFRTEKLAQLDLARVKSDGYAFQIEVTHEAWRLGWKIVEVPITFVDRHAGSSKMSARIVREAVWRVPGLALRGRLRRKEPVA
jgi:dolichol-phosphate mannosyltransferase